MPSIYAHNKFGKNVLRRLGDECREIVRKYPKQFRIGLQGPDYLFFYKAYLPNSINRRGYEIHGEIAAGFFENAVSIVKGKDGDDGALSYLMGFVCHFALDSECHPYISHAIKELGVGHIEIESEFDRYLMESDGYDPLKYPVWKLIPTDGDTSGDVAVFYDGISSKTVRSALRQMKFIKRAFMPDPLKEKITRCMFRLTTHYVDLQGHIMKQKFNPKCVGTNERLKELFKGAEDVAVQLIGNVIMCAEGKAELSERFNRNFE